MISIEDFEKLDIRVGKIKSAEKIENTNKLLKLEIDIGELRTVVAGIADEYEPEELINKEVVFLANLEPKVIRGIESQGMILAADNAGKPVLLLPEKEVPAGTKIR